jgi:hypothetical protein
VYQTDGIGGQAEATVSAKGAVPFIAQPGLTVLYVAALFDAGDADDTHEASTFGAQTVGFEFSPRYHV